MQGYIKAIVLKGGYGFIHSRALHEFAMFRVSDLDGLAFDARLKGLPVEFSPVPTANGVRATRVRPVPAGAN